MTAGGSTTPASGTTPSDTPETSSTTLPNEPLPSLGTETDNAGTTTAVDSAASSLPVVKVNGPTLGANFTGEGDWRPNSGAALTSLTVFTQGRREPADITFGVFAADGASGLTYVSGAVVPSDTYFRLRSDACAGTPVPSQRAAAQNTCNDLVFDPTARATALHPFQATLELNLKLTCSGQDYPACRQVSPAPASASPVTLTFTQSVQLSGSTGCDPLAGASPACSVGGASLSSEPPASGGGGSSPASSGDGGVPSSTAPVTASPTSVSSSVLTSSE